MVDDESAVRFRSDLLEWTEDNRQEFVWRRQDIDIYEMLMAEIFLRRTRPDVVEPVYIEFIDRFPNLRSLKQATQDEIAKVVRPLGLQSKRSKAIYEMAAAIDGDTVPDTQDGLLELPQVGRYVANATLCFGRGDRLPIVDRNVKRVYGRVFGKEWPEKEDAQYDFAEELLPDVDDVRRYNLGLIDHPTYVCTSQKPSCEECFAKRYCDYYQESRTIQG